MIFAMDQSPWVAIPLVVLVMLATPLLGLDRQAPPPSDDFRLLRQRPSSFIIAVCIQLAAIAALIRFPGSAGILLSIGAALLVWRATSVDPQARSRPQRAVALTILAIAFTIFGMLPTPPADWPQVPAAEGRAIPILPPHPPATASWLIPIAA